MADSFQAIRSTYRMAFTPLFGIDGILSVNILLPLLSLFFN